MTGVDIEWDHREIEKSKAGALEMVQGFGLAVTSRSTNPPSTTSNLMVPKNLKQMLLIIHLMEGSMKNSVLLILASSPISCGTNYQVDNVNTLLDENIGWMHGNCLVIKNDNLKELMDVRVVKLADENVIEDAIIIRKANSEGIQYFLKESSVNNWEGYYYLG